MIASRTSLTSARADLRGFYPGIVTARFYESWDFYTDQLGFRTTGEWDHLVQLEHASGARLALMREETDEQCSELVSATDGRGIWLNLQVADADGECARLRDAGVTIVAALEDKPWGDRQFAVRDPNGILIFISSHQPTAEFEPITLGIP